MITSKSRRPFGEVIASNLDTCTIQAWEWETYPPYGSLISIEEAESTIIAIINGITTAPFDHARMPTAYKKTDIELKADHPHIFALLRTIISATTLGTKISTNTLFTMPVKPASIHSFSFILSTDELFFTETNTNAIRRIISLHEPQIADTLIFHHMQHQKNAGTLSGECLRVLITTYIETVGNDYKRIFNLNRFIQAL